MEKIALSKMIAELRRELAESQQAGSNQTLQFHVEEIDLEVKIVSTEEGGINAGVKFWVIDAGGNTKFAAEARQTLRLKLKPLSQGQDLKISSEQSGTPD
jgi:hypothetical protein